MADEEIKKTEPTLDLFAIMMGGRNKETQTPEQAQQERLIKEFYSTDKMTLKADLTKKQLGVIAKLLVFEQVFKTGLVGKMVQSYLELTVSTNREGRKEFERIFKQSADLSLFDTSMIPKKSRLTGE